MEKSSQIFLDNPIGQCLRLNEKLCLLKILAANFSVKMSDEIQSENIPWSPIFLAINWSG